MDNIYKIQYSAALEYYKNSLNKYEKEVTSLKYHNILESMAFEFLNAVQLCEKLSLYKSMKNKPKMHFTSLDEATVFYRKLINFNKKTEKLLEDASYIAEIGLLANQINEHALKTPYLGASFCIEPNREIIQLAEKCLTEIPNFPKILTKEFRWNFIESVILSLDEPDLQWLAESKVIKTNDIDHISLQGTEEYQNKIKFLCQYLNHPNPIIASYQLKLKGVTFPNDDGSSRQQNLAMLHAYMEEKTNEKVVLSVEPYTYMPEIGAPEPAIKVAWNGKVVGNIAKDVVSEILEKYNNPQFSAVVEKVSGGQDGMSWGCTVKFDIIAPGYTAKAQEFENTTDIEKEASA